MVRFFLAAILLHFTLIAFAQKTKTVSVSYTYYANESQSIEEIKRIALERAMIQAISDEFGTAISQTNITSIANNNGQSKVNFSSTSMSDLQGEWVETIGVPVYDINYDDNIVMVKCSVKGVIRKRTQALIDFDVRLLRNTPSLNYESTEFKDGDNLYLYFTSPLDGYLSVYFIDEQNTAYCILPYRNQNYVYRVSANTEYIFFSKKKSKVEDLSNTDEYIMTCNNSTILNRLYIIFSPNKFHKAIDSIDSQAMPRTLSFENFMKWLSKNRNMDIDMNVRNIDFIIKK